MFGSLHLQPIGGWTVLVATLVQALNCPRGQCQPFPMFFLFAYSPHWWVLSCSVLGYPQDRVPAASAPSPPFPENGQVPTRLCYIMSKLPWSLTQSALEVPRHMWNVFAKQCWQCGINWHTCVSWGGSTGSSMLQMPVLIAGDSLSLPDQEHRLMPAYPKGVMMADGGESALESMSIFHPGLMCCEGIGPIQAHIEPE